MSSTFPLAYLVIVRGNRNADLSRQLSLCVAVHQAAVDSCLRTDMQGDKKNF